MKERSFIFPWHSVRVWLEGRAEAWVLTGAYAILVVPTTYALLRGYDVLFRDEPHPSTVGPSLHIAMFWRVNLGVALALSSAPLVLRLASARPDVLWRTLPSCVALATGVALVQGALLP